MTKRLLTPEECIAVIKALGHSYAEVARAIGEEDFKVRRVYRNKKYVDYRLVDKLRAYVEQHKNDVAEFAQTLRSALKE